VSVVTLGETMALLNVPGRLGAGTTLLMVAAELGLQEVKFFPAAQLGGPAAIRALDAPFDAWRSRPPAASAPTT